MHALVHIHSMFSLLTRCISVGKVFVIIHGSPLNLAKDPSAISCSCTHSLERFASWYKAPPPLKRRLKTVLFAYTMQCCPHSDCRRLRFSVTADFVRLTINYYIIIIIITWSERVTNFEVRRRTGQPLLSDTVRTRRLKLFGHVARADRSFPCSTSLHIARSKELEAASLQVVQDT